MDISLIRKVVSEASKHGLREIIPSTMGEPLLYNGFEDILSLCKEYSVKLNLTTNGTFPRKTVAEWAGLIAPVTSDVKISWNGSIKETAESIMKGAKFDRVLRNVKEFIRMRDEIASNGGNYCRVTFQLTFLESNIGELPEIVQLAARLGVDRVKGHHLWVHFNEIEQLSLRRSRESIERWNRTVQLAVEAAENCRLPSGERVLLENIFPLDPSGDEIAPGAVCPFLGREAWISAEGRFNPCCAPDALRRTLGEFGNVTDRRLMDIWRGDGYKGLREKYLTNSLCRGCNMRRPKSELSGHASIGSPPS
jgi:MoaA/NifB/PqqE/SkfB family radical SAM enzyme